MVRVFPKPVVGTYSSQNNVATSNHNSRTNSNPPYRKKKSHWISLTRRSFAAARRRGGAAARRRGGERPGAGGIIWRTGGRYATSGVGLWSTRRTVSKLSANLRRGGLYGMHPGDDYID